MNKSLTFAFLFLLSISMLSAEICKSDFNNDGVVDSSDLSLFQADWGKTTCCENFCSGDLNNDCLVDGLDYLMLRDEYGLINCNVPEETDYCNSDFNNDGVVDDSDLALFQADWGKTTCCDELCIADLNSDCTVDGLDFLIFGDEYNRTNCQLTKPENSCNSDFNNDGVVDDSDLALFQADWGKTTCCDELCIADLNSDCTVDGLDFLIFRYEYGLDNCSIIKCTDSDGGKNFYTKGTAIGLTSTGNPINISDGCIESNGFNDGWLRETYCEGQIATFNDYECPNVCSDGVCLNTTSESQISITLSSEGESKIFWTTEGYSEKGFKVVWSKNPNPTYPLRDGDKYHYYSDPNKNSDTITAFSGYGTYYVRVCEYLGGVCGAYSNEISVELLNLSSETELNCTSQYEKKCYNNHVYWYNSCGEKESKAEYCNYGCKNGICLNAEAIKPLEEPSKMPDKKDDTTYVCEGCEVEGNCYPIGYRESGEYCSAPDFEFISQKSADESCNNNFECDSNICVNDQCISRNFIQKIIDWFKRLFS